MIKNWVPAKAGVEKIDSSFHWRWKQSIALLCLSFFAIPSVRAQVARNEGIIPLFVAMSVQEMAEKRIESNDRQSMWGWLTGAATGSLTVNSDKTASGFGYSYLQSPMIRLGNGLSFAVDMSGSYIGMTEDFEMTLDQELMTIREPVQANRSDMVMAIIRTPWLYAKAGFVLDRIALLAGNNPNIFAQMFDYDYFSDMEGDILRPFLHVDISNMIDLFVNLSGFQSIISSANAKLSILSSMAAALPRLNALNEISDYLQIDPGISYLNPVDGKEYLGTSLDLRVSVPGLSLAGWGVYSFDSTNFARSALSRIGASGRLYSRVGYFIEGTVDKYLLSDAFKSGNLSSATPVFGYGVAAGFDANLWLFRVALKAGFNMNDYSVIMSKPSALNCPTYEFSLLLGMRLDFAEWKHAEDSL